MYSCNKKGGNMRSWCAIGCVFAASCVEAAVTRTGEEIFQKWIDAASPAVHNEFSDKVPFRQGFTGNEVYQQRIKERIERMIAIDEPLRSLLDIHSPDDGVSAPAFVFTPHIQTRLEDMYRGLSSTPTNISLFLKNLRLPAQEMTDLNDREQIQCFTNVLAKYRGLMDIVTLHDDYLTQRAYLFGVANRFFEFCFYDATWQNFKTMLEAEAEHPLVRLLYTTIWHELAGIGWKEWHTSCLDRLRKESQQGKEIVYIAGGCDIYNLLSMVFTPFVLLIPFLARRSVIIFHRGSGWHMEMGKNRG
jgi:hypothetical protein